MTSPRDEVRRLRGLIEQSDKERARLVALRDSALREARSGGATWVEMADDAGLSVNALRKALNRQ